MDTMDTVQPSQKHLEESYKQFTQWTMQQDLVEGKSSMWKNMIKDFDPRNNSAESKGKAFSLKAHRSYNFFHAEHETILFHLSRHLLVASYWMARVFRFLCNKTWQLNSRYTFQQLLFHPAGRQALDKFGFYKGYRKFCDHFKFSLYCQNGIKLYYIAGHIISYLKAPPP